MSARHWLTAAQSATPHRPQMGVASVTTTVAFEMQLPTTTGPAYHQRQAGTKRSNVAASYFHMLVSIAHPGNLSVNAPELFFA